MDISLDSRRKVERFLIIIIAAYTAVVVSLVFTVGIIGSRSSRDRAVLLMAAGLILIWVILGGLLTLRYRNSVRNFVLHSPIDWKWKFLMMATALALIEEAITTTMTNLAPQFGSKVGVAFITASNNYLVVIAFSSVVVFVPEFAGWMLLLKRYSFTPAEVFLMYGLLGTTMEATINPTSLYAGFWFFVYGLMVYLPAYSLPEREGTIAPRWYHYILAYFVPLACALPVVAADTLLAHLLGIHLWH